MAGWFASEKAGETLMPEGNAERIGKCDNVQHGECLFKGAWLVAMKWLTHKEYEGRLDSGELLAWTVPALALLSIPYHMGSHAQQPHGLGEATCSSVKCRQRLLKAC
jgi:hypothetical protein